jgi:hypothetical protein
MPDESISIETKGLDELMHNLHKAPAELTKAVSLAGDESAKVILGTRGIQNYPSETAANRPPTPYYIRGRGTQVSSGRNLLNSERLGTRWNVRKERQGFLVKIGNPTSYAGYVHGGPSDRIKQAWHMAKKGWRMLWGVARQKTRRVTRIYDEFADRALKLAGLK